MSCVCFYESFDATYYYACVDLYVWMRSSSLLVFMLNVLYIDIFDVGIPCLPYGCWITYVDYTCWRSYVYWREYEKNR